MTDSDDQRPEAYVDRAEMARRLGISISLLDKMVSRGEIPSVTWGRRTRRFVLRGHRTRRESRRAGRWERRRDGT